MSPPKEVTTRREEPLDDHLGAEKHEILSWVCALDMRQKQAETLALRAEGTGDWILSAPQFKEWLSGCSQTPILWCPGLPHTGKTTLTSIVIDHLSKTCISPNSALAYIYCAATNPFDNLPNENTALLLLSSICRQLASQKAGLHVQLRKLYKQMTPDKERPGIDDVMLVILSLCDSFEKVFICVDGLEACDPNGERAILISKIQWMRNHSARIFVGSEIHHSIPEPCDCQKDIFDAFEHDGRILITAVDEDIRSCLLQRPRKDSTVGNQLVKSCITAELLVEPIIADCEGMYLTAQLKLDRELRRLHLSSEEDAARMANSSTTATIAATQRMQVWHERLQNVQNQQWVYSEIALISLSWIMYAKEPICVPEFAQALSHDFGKVYVFSPDGLDVRVTVRDMDWEYAGSLLKICKGLVVFRGEDERVCLADDCVPDLSSAQLEDLFPNAHSRITRICLTFLGLNIVLASEEVEFVHDEEEMKEQQSAVSFKRYAQRHWASHLLECQDEAVDALAVTYLHKVFTRPARWLEERQPFYGPVVFVRVIDDETPLLKAARFGLKRVLVKLLASQEYDIDAKSWRGQSALSVAVAGGHTSTVQLLYMHGASIVRYKNQYGDTLLHMAAEKNDEIMVPLLVYYGFRGNVDVKSPGNSDMTPLQVAVEHKSVRAAEMLLDYGADMSVQNRAFDLMHSAVSSGDENMVKLLVRRGFDLSTPSGERPLIFSAVDAGSLQLVKYMVACGADVLEVDKRRTSAIHRAAEKGHLEMVTFLLEHGADPFMEDDGPNERCDGSTALGIAMAANHQDVVKFLLPRLGGHVPKQTILSIVRAAMHARLPETVTSLLDMVPGDLTFRSRHCAGSLLGVAIGKDDDEMINVLLDRGLSPTLQDELGYSPLHVAAGGHPNAAKILLDRGADLNLISKYGMTPVHVAAYEGEMEVLEILLEYSPDLSIRAEDGSTALVAATYSLKPEATQLLLSHGAPVNLNNIDGETVLHYAVLDGDDGLVRNILELDINVSILSRKAGSALHLAAFKGHAGIVRQLLDNGADLELSHEYRGEGYVPPESPVWENGVLWDRAGSKHHRRMRYWSRIETQWKPLHSAVCGGHSAVVDILLQHGANISSKGLQGETPLHLAASAAAVEIVKILLKAGADISAVDNNGDTPLHAAALASAALAAARTEMHSPHCARRKHAKESPADLKKSACVATLLNHGADPTCENLQGLTPLAMAAGAGHEDVVRTLIDRNPSHLQSNAAYVKLLKACVAGGIFNILEMLSAHVPESGDSLLVWQDIFHSACKAGDHKMVSLALQADANPNRSHADGTYPLHNAITMEQVKIVDSLLTAGADLMEIDALGRNALHIASSNIRHYDDKDTKTLIVNYGDRKKERIAAYLLEDGAPVNFRTPDGDTALHFAVATGDKGLVLTLLRNGASANVRNRKGCTPLHAAVSTFIFPEIVTALLENGACPTAQDHAGRTPLHSLHTNNGYKQWIAAATADLLLRNGADHSLRARNGDTAIHCAVRQLNLQLAQRLLEAGASVCDEGARRRTLLHIAAQRGHVAMVEPLIKLGCEVSAVDAKGWTPLHHAANEQHLEVLSILLKHGGQAPWLLMSGKERKGRVSPIGAVLGHGNTKVTELLADAGIPLHG